MAFLPKRIYTEPIEIGRQPLTWIAKHRSFASTEWMESQVRYGEWTPDQANKQQFVIYTIVLEGIKPLTVLIKIRVLEGYVLVYHAHVVRNK
jgi:sulfopyruvate decarboxylase TPP-binding subunit